MAMQPQGLQALMPQRPQPISQPRPAMPNMANPRMGAAMGLVDNDLEQLGIDPRTRAAMKAQEAVDLLASADADMAMGQPRPVPEKIIDQRKQQASEGIVGLLQQLMPGMQQRGQQMQRRPPMGGMPARPAPARPPMGGMPARPAPARPPMGGMPSMGAPNMARMADGGIVGYAEGDLVKKEKLTPMQYGQQKFNHRMAMKIKDYEELKKLETKYKEQSNNAGLENVRLGLERYDGSLVEEAYNSKLRYDKAKSEGMAMGGIVGYAGPDGSQVQSQAPQRPIAGQPSAAVPDQAALVTQFLAAYSNLQADLKAAKPQEKDLFRQRVQDLINTTPSSVVNAAFGQGMARGGIVGYQDGGRVKRYQGTSEDGSLVEGDKAQNLRAMMQSSLPWDAAPTATAASVAENISEEEIISLISQADDAEIARILAANFPKGSIEEQKQRKFAEVVANVNRQPAGANVRPDTSVGIMSGGRGDTDNFAPAVGVDTRDAGNPPTTPEQGILERMRTNQAAVTPTTRTASTLASQLEEVLGGQLGALDGARKKETGLAEAALGVSEAEKQAAEELVKADEAYYGKVLDPAERRRRENEVIMQAYLSGNSLVDQARRSGAAQSQLRRQGYTQEREAAKVRPQNTVKLEAQDRGIRGQVYTAGRDAEKDARSTLNQTIQTTGNYINSIENREAQIALESSRQSMQILKAEMDLLVAGKRIDQESKNMFARYLDGIQDNIVKLRQSLGDVAGDPVMGDEAISREQQTLRDAIRELETASTAIAVEIGLPMSSQASPTGGSNVTPEQQAADAILGI